MINGLEQTPKGWKASAWQKFLARLEDFKPGRLFRYAEKEPNECEYYGMIVFARQMHNGGHLCRILDLPEEPSWYVVKKESLWGVSLTILVAEKSITAFVSNAEFAQRFTIFE